MNKNNDALVNQRVTIYLDGGWELSGMICRIEGEKIILENNEGSFLVFKGRVCCIKISTNHDNRPENTNKSLDSGSPYSDLGMHIPMDMLSKESRAELQSNNDFSVSFKPATKDSVPSDGSNMVFRLEDDSKE
tara:strand:- start:8726 stop:9124 length:399 start_codon:yes stop_codon:yes gene_type:complete